VVKEIHTGIIRLNYVSQPISADIVFNPVFFLEKRK
jgi:hypothetical protein